MKEERFPHTRKPLRGRKLRVAEGESFGATEESAATGVQRAKRRDSCTEDRCQAALSSPRGLCAHPPGWAGLGAEARASMLAGRESGKKSAAAEEARDFFLPLCFAARKERGFRVPPKRTPETGASRGYQHGPQRRAQAAAISADPTATGAQREKRRDSRTEAQRRAALTSPRGLSAHPPGRAGLGAEARASVLAGRESGKKSAAAEEARDFFLTLCFVARKERGFRAPPKRTPDRKSVV